MAEVVLNPVDLVKKMGAFKTQGRKIVLADGCFDLLHVGHVRYLRAAKALGDILVLALNSDASVQRVKGPGRPLLPLEDRLGVLAAFEMVDYLTSFDEDRVDSLLSLLQPHLYAKRPGRPSIGSPSFGGHEVVVQEGADHTADKLIQEILRKYGPLQTGNK